MLPRLSPVRGRHRASFSLRTEVASVVTRVRSFTLVLPPPRRLVPAVGRTAVARQARVRVEARERGEAAAEDPGKVLDRRHPALIEDLTDNVQRTRRSCA